MQLYICVSHLHEDGGVALQQLQVWHRMEWGSEALRVLHKVALEHSGHIICLINNDWWCSCSDEHTAGMVIERYDELDFEWGWSREHGIEETEDFFTKVNSIHSLTNCGGYAKPCRCYGP